MASRDAGAIVGCRTRRANDVRPNRCDASAESSHRTHVRSVTEGQALGTPEARAGSMTDSPRKYRGFDPEGVAETEADHFGNCPVCGAFIDTRNIAKMLAHVHGAEIEISEGQELPARRGVSTVQDRASRGRRRSR
jgi:hypothetical protein